MAIETDALLLALGLFSLRVINYSISTIRLVFIARGRRFFAAMLAFLEALIFAVVMASVIADLTNILNLLAYCFGAMVGSWMGMALESRFVTSYSTIQIITPEHGSDIATALRDKGYGVTVTYGEGRDGEVTIVRSSAVNRDVPFLLKIVRQIHPDAFVEIEQARALQRGWIPGGPPRR